MDNNELRLICYDRRYYKETLTEDLIEINGKKISKKFIRGLVKDENLHDSIIDFLKGESKVLKFVYKKKTSMVDRELRHHLRLKSIDLSRFKEKDLDFDFFDIIEFELSRIDIILFLRTLYELDKEDSSIKEFDKISLEELKEYEDSCLSFNSLIESHKEEEFKYNIDENTYQINFADIYNFYNCSEEEYQRLLKSPTINGIKKEHFIYACVKYIENNVMGTYLLPDNIYKRYKELSSSEIVDIQAINLITETNNPDAQKTKINEELRESIFKEMPESLSNLEKAIYIYIQMCKILSYDDEFYALNQKGERFTRNHKDINYTGSITPNNPKVVCYEFNAIYAKLLEELGINCEVDRDFFGHYGSGHASLYFRVDKYLVNADSTASILNGDMIQAKLNNQLNGLYCINNNKDTEEEFNNAVKKVYEIIIKSEKKPGLEEIISEYRKIKEKEEKTINIDIEEKLNTLVDIINTLEVSDMDRIGIIRYLFKIIFTEEEKNRLFINIMKSKGWEGTNIYASSNIIFTIIKDPKTTEHFQYKPGSALIKKTGEELVKALREKDISYIKDDDDLIPISIRGGRK